MESRRVFRTSSPSTASRQSNARPNMSYARRPTTPPVVHNVDGLAVRGRGLIPASQEEYIDSLSGAPSRLSRSPRQMNYENKDNIFALNARQSFFRVRRQVFAIKSVFPALVILFFVLVSIIAMTSMRSGKTAGANRSQGRSSVESLIDTSDEISERRPTNMQSYQVSGELPRMLYINNMGLSARVRRVGVGTETELRLPSNIYDVGWYESSVKPGEIGAVVLTGHASGPSKPGIFHDLTELKPGAEFELETGDGDTFTYYVAKLEAFRENDPLEPMLAPAVPGVPGLNLITETGSYDAKANTYDQRLVVYAIQKNSSSSKQKTQAN